MSIYDVPSNLGRSEESKPMREGRVTQLSFKSRLEHEAERLSQRLTDIQGVLKAMNKNPELTKVLEAFHTLKW